MRKKIIKTSILHTHNKYLEGMIMIFLLISKISTNNKMLFIKGSKMKKD